MKEHRYYEREENGKRNVIISLTIECSKRFERLLQAHLYLTNGKKK